MPKSRLAWSCWNYLTFSDGSQKANIDRVSLYVELSLSYAILSDIAIVLVRKFPLSRPLLFLTSTLTDGMNDLQHIPEEKYGPVLATLNPPPEIKIDERKVQGRWKYEHPVLDDKVFFTHYLTTLLF